jgi:erythromycin esterase
MGFTGVALESGFTESRTVEEFVRGGPGDAQSVALHGLTSGFGHLIANRDLIQWMRDYNAAAAKTGQRSIHFYGADLTAGGRISGPRRVLDSLLAFVARANPAEANKIGRQLGSLPRSDDNVFGDLSPSAQAELDTCIPAIAKAMAVNRDSLIAHSCAEEYRWALQDLEVARQLAQGFHASPPGAGLRDAGPAIEARDSAMAENVRWALENEGPNGRVIVFAANGHVMNWQQDGGTFAEVREKPFMMGSYLRRAFGKDLLVIATSSATSSGGLPPPEPIEDDIDGALAQVGLPRMILDLRTAQQDPGAFAWVSQQRALHRHISTHVLVTPATAVDVFFFVDGLTPAVIVPF